LYTCERMYCVMWYCFVNYVSRWCSLSQKKKQKLCWWWWMFAKVSFWQDHQLYKLDFCLISLFIVNVILVSLSGQCQIDSLKVIDNFTKSKKKMYCCCWIHTAKVFVFTNYYCGLNWKLFFHPFALLLSTRFIWILIWSKKKMCTPILLLFFQNSWIFVCSAKKKCN
jgi:hypothetical protein